MKKRLLITLMLVSVMSMLFGEQLIDKWKLYQLRKDGIEKMELAFEEDRSIYLHELASFEGQKACLIPPYMVKEEIKKLVGSDYQLDYMDNMDDGAFYALFLRPDKHSVAIPISRKAPDLFEQHTCITHTEAVEAPIAILRR